MTSPGGTRTCAITGAGGYLGGRFRAALEQRGWRVRGLLRNPLTSQGEVRFQLGETVAEESLTGVDALVHCAYDFGPRAWPEMERVNVRGSELLFAAGRSAGISRIIFISSLSAFEGCRSMYGRAKLETEAIAQRFGATVLRPGLVYGEPTVGLFGKLVEQVRRSTVLPLVGGNQPQYLVHDQDLAALVCRFVAGDFPTASGPVTVAHEQPWTLRAMLEAIAAGLGRKPMFFPLPWRPVWLALRTAELAGMRPRFRSDSLVSLMFPNPKPDFGPMHKLGIQCHPFRSVPALD